MFLDGGCRKNFVTVGSDSRHKIYELSTLNPKRGGIFHGAMHLDVFGWGVKSRKNFVTVGGDIRRKIYELSTLNPKRGGIFRGAMHLDVFGWGVKKNFCDG